VVIDKRRRGLFEFAPVFMDMLDSDRLSMNRSIVSFGG